MSQYIHTHKDWPNFHWDDKSIISLLAKVRNRQGLLTGKMEAIGFHLKNEAYLETLSMDVLRSSEIEGEILDTAQVRSSIARKLGMDIAGLVESDRDVDGVVDMMLDATTNWNQVLSTDRLFGWHSALFPEGRSGMYKILVGKWRDDSTGPMQVVSGAMGKERVHFEAPKAEHVPAFMHVFLEWVNRPKYEDPVLNAALSHLWFVTIHPFEDGNGRMARAIADMMLCRSENRHQRYYSMSAQINGLKKEYYHLLEDTQKGTLDVAEWMIWFLKCLENAIDSSESVVNKIIAKHKFWNDYKSVTFNARQIKIIDLLFGNFFGILTTTKWAKITKCSPDTALRDVQDLIQKGIMKKSKSGGRSTNYELMNFNN